MSRTEACSTCEATDAFRYDQEADGRKTIWLLAGWDYSRIDPQHEGRTLYCGGCGQVLGVAEDVLDIVEDVT